MVQALHTGRQIDINTNDENLKVVR